MKYTKNNTYYAIIDEKIKELKFKRTIKETHNSLWSTREETYNIFSFIENNLEVEVKLPERYKIFTDRTAVEYEQRFRNIEKHLLEKEQKEMVEAIVLSCLKETKKKNWFNRLFN